MSFLGSAVTAGSKLRSNKDRNNKTMRRYRCVRK